MKQTIQLGTERVSYTVEWKQVKNINLRLRKDTGLSVSAPKRVSLAEIEQVIRQHEKQILQTLQEYQKEAAEKRQQYPVQYVTGESVLYLGKYYTLEVTQGKTSAVFLEGERLFLQVQHPENSGERKRVFDTWWYDTCQKAIQNLCRAVYPIYEAHKISYPEIKFRTMVSQWGNCRPTRGILTFNLRLLAAPVRCMEYVVLHEFTHFLYPNHSKAFYAFIQAEMPDWKKIQQLLQKTVEVRI